MDDEEEERRLNRAIFGDSEDPNNPGTFKPEVAGKINAVSIANHAQHDGYDKAREWIDQIKDKPFFRLVKPHLDPQWHGLLPGATFEEIRRLPPDPYIEGKKALKEFQDLRDDKDHFNAEALKRTYERDGIIKAARFGRSQSPHRDAKRMRQFLPEPLHGTLHDANDAEKRRTILLATNDEERNQLIHLLHYTDPDPDPPKKKGWFR